MIPPLHLITNDLVVGSSGFLDRAKAAIVAGGDRVVVHVRSRETPPRVVLKLADELHRACADSGARVSLNDRLDVALAVGTGWAHLGSDSMRPSAARQAVGPDCVLGVSLHSVAEVEDLGDYFDFVDYVVAGHVYETRSHPGVPGRGLKLIHSVREVFDNPGRDTPLSSDSEIRARGLIAIGGVSTDRVAEVVEAGADGVAVLSGVWDSGDPGKAVTRYLQALHQALNQAPEDTGRPGRPSVTRTDSTST